MARGDGGDGIGAGLLGAVGVGASVGAAAGAVAEGGVMVARRAVRALIDCCCCCKISWKVATMFGSAGGVGVGEGSAMVGDWRRSPGEEGGKSASSGAAGCRSTSMMGSLGSWRLMVGWQCQGRDPRNQETWNQLGLKNKLYRLQMESKP